MSMEGRYVVTVKSSTTTMSGDIAALYYSAGLVGQLANNCCK